MKLGKEKIRMQSSGSYESWWKVECDCGKVYRAKLKCGATRCPYCDRFINIAIRK